MDDKLTLDASVEIPKKFKNIDQYCEKCIELSNLQKALEECDIKLPVHKIEERIDEIRKRNPRKDIITLGEFEQFYEELQSEMVPKARETITTKRVTLQTLGGMSNASSMETTHSFSLKERQAFCDWINVNLCQDPDLSHLLPINPAGNELYSKVKDGVLLCKIINHSCPGTIDEHAINKENLTVFREYENLTLALCSAQAVGCNIVNIHANNLYKGLPHLVLGFLWQIIRIGLFNNITLEKCPGLMALLSGREDIDELMKLSPEAILIRWINHHLQQAGNSRRIQTFTTDMKDSIVYTHLLCQIAPEGISVTTNALKEQDLLRRAEIMLQEADKLGCRNFLLPTNVVDGNFMLNLAFVANLFNKYPHLEEPVEISNMTWPGNAGVLASSRTSISEKRSSIKETREEKTYRNWLNSIGVTPYVNWLYSDLCDGLIICQLFDIITPGSVDWDRIHKMPKKMMEMLENCNYVMELGKNANFSLVGIEGHDLMKGNHTFTLAFLWQLMNAYTFSTLSRITKFGDQVNEKDIIHWANRKLASTGKQTSVRHFQDSSLSDATVIIDLIDAIKPGIIDYNVVRNGQSIDDKMENAKYAISMGHKIGASIYALPEDITEVVPKKVMSVFASLMVQDFTSKYESVS